MTIKLKPSSVEGRLAAISFLTAETRTFTGRGHLHFLCTTMCNLYKHLCFSMKTSTGSCWAELLVLVTDFLQNVDEALQSEHVSTVRSVVDGLVIAEAFEGAVGEVDHAHIHAQRLRRRMGLRGRRVLHTAQLLRLRGPLPASVHRLGVLALVYDEQRAGVEAV